MRLLVSLFLLSAATLVFELNLTRIFSVAQYYHFAFLVVSLALLGFGASGSLLALFPAWCRRHVPTRVGWLALGCAASIMGSYLLINALPFDSYAIAWDGRQLGYLALYLLSLAVPFGFSGMAVGLLLAAYQSEANRIYAVNLVGSSLGCLATLGALPLLGGEGTVVFSAWLALVAAAVLLIPAARPAGLTGRIRRWIPAGFTVAAWVVLSLWLVRLPPFLSLNISPYKGLYQALLNPDAEHVFSRWNAFSRLDVVESPGIRSLPGLSFAYQGAFPLQVGVAVDGDNLMPITAPGESDWAAALPEALPYQLRPGARALIVAPGGGLATATALANGASELVVVEANPLLVEIVRDDYDAFTRGLYRDPRVSIAMIGPRALMRQTAGQAPADRMPFDVVHLALTDPHRTVRSGAYSLGESYLYTIEAFYDALRLLGDDGILVATRWLQSPPSETVKLFALALEALERIGVPAPEYHLAALRSFQTGTLLVKGTPWTADEIAALRQFCHDLRFDLTYYPGMERTEANRFSILTAPVYHDAYTTLVTAPDRVSAYQQFEFDVRPPTDDRPFFFNFFRWQQAPQVLQELGKTWQPFGGAGYFVLLILLALAALAAVLFILLPVALPRLFSRRRQDVAPPAGDPSVRTGLMPLGSPRSVLLYFGLLGLGFLLVEIPLIQQFILFVDQPTYAFVAVLFAVLLSSGFGSLTAKRWHPAVALGLLVVLILVYPPLLRLFFSRALAWPLVARLALTLPALAPLCFMMGVPFSRGLTLLKAGDTALVPWAWAINGSTSVIAGILAAILALAFGFSWVLWLGAAAYAGAFLVVLPRRR